MIAMWKNYCKFVYNKFKNKEHDTQSKTLH